MKSLLVALLSALLLASSACSRIYGNLYEGVQMQKRQEVVPSIDARGRDEQPPGYDEYLRRRRQATEDPGAQPELP